MIKQFKGVFMLAEPIQLLYDEDFPTVTGRQNVVAAERRLWQAVLQQALEDLISRTPGGARPSEYAKIKRETRAWFRSKSTGRGSFRWIVDQVLRVDTTTAIEHFTNNPPL